MPPRISSRSTKSTVDPKIKHGVSNWYASDADQYFTDSHNIRSRVKKNPGKYKYWQDLCDFVAAYPNLDTVSASPAAIEVFETYGGKQVGACFAFCTKIFGTHSKMHSRYLRVAITLLSGGHKNTTLKRLRQMRPKR